MTDQQSIDRVLGAIGIEILDREAGKITTITRGQTPEIFAPHQLGSPPGADFQGILHRHRLRTIAHTRQIERLAHFPEYMAGVIGSTAIDGDADFDAPLNQFWHPTYPEPSRILAFGQWATQSPRPA